MMEPTRCELCGRHVQVAERHHLIPRTRHRNKRNKKQFGRRDVHGRIAMLCRPCHKTLHATFTEKQLECDYNTLEAIRAHPDVVKFVRWIRNRPPEMDVRVRRSGGQDDLRRDNRLRRRLRKDARREPGGQ